MKFDQLEELKDKIERNHSSVVGGICIVILINLLTIGIILFK